MVTHYHRRLGHTVNENKAVRLNTSKKNGMSSSGIDVVKDCLENDYQLVGVDNRSVINSVLRQTQQTMYVESVALLVKEETC